MTDYTILKGMSDWTIKYNALANSIVTSNWTTNGLVFVNGFAAFSQEIANTIKYRTIDNKGTRTVQFAGAVKTPALSASASGLAMLKVPLSLFEGHKGFIQQYDRYTCFWGDQWCVVQVKPETGELCVTNMSMRDDKNVKASSLQINYSISW